MKDLVEFIARELVEHPDAVEVAESGSGSHRVVRLNVAEDDLGKVIGRQGRVAQSMRAMLKVAAAREGVRASLEIS